MVSVDLTSVLILVLFLIILFLGQFTKSRIEYCISCEDMNVGAGTWTLPYNIPLAMPTVLAIIRETKLPRN